MKIVRAVHNEPKTLDGQKGLVGCWKQEREALIALNTQLISVGNSLSFSILLQIYVLK